MEKYALVLSGGGARGAYQIGVWQALRELNIPIHIVTGTSVGALNGCLVAQDRFDDAVELWEQMETRTVFDVKEDSGRLGLRTGTSGLADLIKKYADEEAIRQSSIDYGLVMVQLPEMKPHYLFVDQIKEGKLHDCILASAACFPALAEVEIDGCKFVDGGYADVMPVQMAMERGADCIIAVFLDALGIVRKKRLKKAEKNAKSLRIIRSHWDLGDLLTFDSNNSKRIMRLGYLDALKSYKIYDGIKYTFRKGIFDRHQLLGAEAAAKAFKLDPTVIYDEKNLREKFQLEIANSSIADFNITRLENIKEQLTPSSLVIHIALDLQKKEADSIFMNKPAFNLLKKEIQAANFLISFQIV